MVRRALMLLLNLPHVLTAQDPTDGVRPVPFKRLHAYTVAIGEPGVAVIRTGAEWKELWRFYGHQYGWYSREGGPDSTASPPSVEFGRYMIIAVGLGGMSGCGPHAAYVNRIEQHGQVLRVVIGEDNPPEPYLTCAAYFEVVDFVRVARDDRRRVVFSGARPEYRIPSAASWWVTPSLQAALDTARTTVGRVSRRVLPRDPATPPSALLRLAQSLGERPDEGLAWALLQNPRVRANAAILLAITAASPYGDLGRRARVILTDLHGGRLASEPATSVEMLAQLIQALDHEADKPELARLLVHHPTVRNSQRLLRDLTFWGQRYSEVSAEACRLYTTRWPTHIPVERDSAGRPRAWISALCPPRMP